MRQTRVQLRQPLFHTRYLWQRVGLYLSILTLTLLFTLPHVESVHARHTPNRHDRRPDRESRIRYPRSLPQPSTNQGESGTLHSAPPPALTTPSPPDGDAAPSSPTSSPTSD